LLSKKNQKIIKSHFGPGNHAHFVASRKDNVRDFDDYECQDDEEGLDEREPEKAICPDNSKALITSSALNPQ
jgi:hypothetical protein